MAQVLQSTATSDLMFKINSSLSGVCAPRIQEDVIQYSTKENLGDQRKPWRLFFIQVY